MDVDGRRIHLWHDGVGTPTVVVVPALGEPALNWAGVLPVMAVETTTVLFDKAHVGWSDPAWGADSARRHADDLRQALQQAGIGPPYILVGPVSRSHWREFEHWSTTSAVENGTITAGTA
ncbi:hypothetical protein [Nonomuraea recticatena]|uniref:hypothetical protein n=1 Tax=Nonomuraea recticatena TaxID=46178 RepID=UPI0031F74D07